MSSQEELRKIVDEVRDDPARRDMSRIIEREHSQARFEGFGEWDQARLVAHHLHAADYRKPRTVTTIEELDALPTYSVIRTSGTETNIVPRVAVKTGFWNGGSEWQVADEEEWTLGSDELDDLPATVLYEPEAAA